jgi:hydroxyquinol 1,2-dioxygenase
VFGVRASLVADFVRHAAHSGPRSAEVDGPYHTLGFDFVMAPLS